MKLRNYLLILTLALCGLSKVAAQDIGGSMMERFMAGRQQFQGAFGSYVDSINLAFAEYLARNWESFKVEFPVPPPSKPEPLEIPVYVPDNTQPVETPVVVEPLPVDTILHDDSNKEDMQTITEDAFDMPGAPTMEFFGTPVALNYVKAGDARLGGTAEKQVADYWKQLSKTNYSAFVSSLNAKRAALGLGAWGVYRLILEWANTYFSASRENDKAVFIVYMLNQAGYKAKIGRARDELLVMIAFRHTIYGKSYIRSGNDSYYILSDRTLSGVPIASYKLDYSPTLSYINLQMNTPPKLVGNIRTVERTFGDKVYAFKCNKNIADYYDTFPQTELSIYADAPLSTVVEESLMAGLRQDLEGKTTVEKISFLLTFIQNAFAYKTDGEQFGREKFFFPEETIFYPYSDCEDRAILFCRMVKLFCGLDSLLIEYPTHVASAVKSAEPGDAIIYNNERYLVCDPTYIGAPIGKTMKGYDNATAKIIALK
ncbi:MAG: hypothetical protein LBJ58_02785 [Tannerellaceae bacterium]|jgi:hypothetical protein|nr:hypothetical protein [Tannerellaceae bacterium]